MAPKDRRPRKARPKDKLDDKLDRALEDTFPASDPVGFIEPGPGDPADRRRKEDKATSA
jgi:hypothetical protein